MLVSFALDHLQARPQGAPFGEHTMPTIRILESDPALDAWITQSIAFLCTRGYYVSYLGPEDHYWRHL